MSELVVNNIENMIYEVRGKQVMLDSEIFAMLNNFIMGGSFYTYLYYKLSYFLILFFILSSFCILFLCYCLKMDYY